ncbi:cyclin-D1-1 [Aristolochia californica]|uniref:cyclin-D1-1 n=1 Tax=Aristolochia californica TaxID=171875 RepID=UPI0035D8584B
MPLPYSDCFSDLLCGEDSEIFAADVPDVSPEYSTDLELPADIDDFIEGLVAEEREYSPGLDYTARFRSRSLDATAREEAITWILKVHAYYHFQPLTAYLSVNYMDRFLASHRLPQANGWPLQLLSVASLSLAAKMEETLVPSLLDLQVEGALYIFEPRTIRRMEFLVLNALNWRLRSITPFSFINFFAYKVDPSGAFTRFLVSRAMEIILATIQEIDFLDYWPSSVAAAAMLCAANVYPSLASVNPGKAVTWCVGLSKEKIIYCYRRMQQVVVEKNSKRKPPKILPQLRVTTLTEMGSGDSSSSSSSTSKKRRKLNNCSWVDNDDDDEEDDDDDNKEGL